MITGHILNWGIAPSGTGTANFILPTTPLSNQTIIIGTSSINNFGDFSLTLSDPPSGSLQSTPAGALPNCGSNSTATASDSYSSVSVFVNVLDNNGKSVGRAGLANTPSAIIGTSTSPAPGSVARILLFSTASVTLSGICNYLNESGTYNNVILTPGWNYITQTYSTNNTYTISNIAPPDNVHWYYADYPDIFAPTINLYSNIINVTLSGSIFFSTLAGDNVGIIRVEFYDGTTKIGEDSTQPYELTINLTSADNGTKS